MTITTSDLTIGGICCLLSAFGFGSMFVPVKPYALKDGLFIQWVQCSSILFCGTVVYVARGLPPFYPAASLAGVIWGVGNLLTVPIINTIGAGLGILLWGSVQIIVGWATGRYGLFGLDVETPKNDLFEYIGVGLTLISAVGFACVKPSQHVNSTEEEGGEPSLTQKATAIAMAIVAGVFFGGMMTPVTYIEDRYAAASQDGLDYVFAYCVGVYCTSTVAFIAYAAFKRNKPYMHQELFLPGIVYGVLWSIAMFSWLVSSQKLSQAISFPISTRLPGVIAALWGVFYFKEVTGAKNLIIMTIAVIVAIAGVVCVGLADVID